MLLRLYILCLSFALVSLAAPPSNVPTLVNLRIEGAKKTTFEADIFTIGHNVTTKSGGNHICNGLNLNANPRPGPTCTSALADGEIFGHYTFDGTFDPEFDDFFITQIGPDAETSTDFWGILLDFQFTPVGGCQQEVKTGSKILWAFNAFNVAHFLELSGPAVGIKGETVTLKVTDGSTGVVISGATIDGTDLETDANGEVKILLEEVGVSSFKAERSDSIRSNRLDIVVA